MQERKDAQEKIAELEFELRLFEDGIKSSFWTVLQTQWKPIVDTATGAALSSQCPERSFAAGKANGMHNFLRYPEKHVKKLRNDIKMLKTNAGLPV